MIPPISAAELDLPGRERLFVIRHGIILLAAACALALAGSGTPLQPCAPALAQNVCSSGCKAAYGNCYKSTHDRTKCQAQLQRCLEGCIRGKHNARPLL